MTLIRRAQEPAARRFAYLDHPGPIPMAHRGGAKHPDNLGYENTRRAFAHAVSLGYRYLETDVHATVDGVLLAFHDHGLDRVTDGAGLIAQLPYAHVARARVNGTEPIPVFADLVEAFPRARFNIDVKADNAVNPLIDLIASMDLIDRVCVSSFSQRRVHRIRRALGRQLCTGFGPLELAVLRFGPVPVVLPGAGGCLQVPIRHGNLVLPTPALLARAHAAGRQVHVWTIDDAEQMIRLLDAGVDGIITDRTDVLRDVLIARDSWQQDEP